MNDSLARLEQLYREIGPDLLAFFRRRGAAESSADDLLQDTFVRAIRTFDRLKNSVSPRAYLFGIARNVAFDTWRRLKPVEALFREPPATAEEVDEDARLEPMRRAIAQLPATLREIILLKLQHELSYEELAEVLDIPIGTVRSRLHHAVRRLRAALSPASDQNL
jgi:RNA polymerase sigma-70 factor (ECF subfamily)